MVKAKKMSEVAMAFLIFIQKIKQVIYQKTLRG